MVVVVARDIRALPMGWVPGKEIAREARRDDTLNLLTLKAGPRRQHLVAESKHRQIARHRNIGMVEEITKVRTRPLSLGKVHALRRRILGCRRVEVLL